MPSAQGRSTPRSQRVPPRAGPCRRPTLPPRRPTRRPPSRPPRRPPRPTLHQHRPPATRGCSIVGRLRLSPARSPLSMPRMWSRRLRLCQRSRQFQLRPGPARCRSWSRFPHQRPPFLRRSPHPAQHPKKATTPLRARRSAVRRSPTLSLSLSPPRLPLRRCPRTGRLPPLPSSHAPHRLPWRHR